MKDEKETIASYSNKSAEERKNWYSNVSQAYDNFRPRYPTSLIDRIKIITNLSPESKTLEIGCGPAIATTALAQQGFSIVCVEPNAEFCQLAEDHCKPFPKVNIKNSLFEEVPLEPESFDAIIAASSFHWISPALGYSKIAQALTQNGYLILLWNKEVQPQYNVYQSLSPIYQKYAPELDKYEDQETQEQILKSLGQGIIDFGYFHNVVFETKITKVSYKVNDYLMLLNTYSPYFKLDISNKLLLFDNLKAAIKNELGDEIELYYLSALHIMRKNTFNP